MLTQLLSVLSINNNMNNNNKRTESKNNIPERTGKISASRRRHCRSSKYFTLCAIYTSHSLGHLHLDFIYLF